MSYQELAIRIRARDERERSEWQRTLLTVNAITGAALTLDDLYASPSRSNWGKDDHAALVARMNAAGVLERLPEKPDPEKPDPEKPDPEKPDPEKPDPEKPDHKLAA